MSEQETTMNATRIDRGSTDTTTIYQDGTDLVFERVFDAPRAVVWHAFTEADRVARWWGQKGSTTVVTEMDVRPGGTWRYISSAPGREDVTFYGEYLTVDPIDGYSWTFMFDIGFGETGGPEDFRFQDLGGRTKVTSIGHFDAVESIEGALATGMVGGAIETWDRLEQHLAEG